MAMRFSKMHGAGNDFVVLDLRGGRAAPDAALAQAMGDRHRGVGFDQLLTVEDPIAAGSLARYRIWNSDGGQAEQCGNGARCVAAWLVRDGAARDARFTLDSPAGPIEVERLDDGRYALDMGCPEFEPARIPLAMPREAVHYFAEVDGETFDFGACSMGNPHALLLVDDIARAPVARLGPALQQSGLFPAGVNVGFAQVLAPDRIALRVHERGAGETLACGSGACAAVAILVRMGRVGRRVLVQLPGGELEIRWAGDDQPIRMTGPATFVFEGEFNTVTMTS
jgi:diaminopimelate epimerase